MVANRARSEHTLELAGNEYTLLYSHHAIALIEEILNKSMLEISTMLSYMRFGYREMHGILMAGLEGYRTKRLPDAKPWTMQRVEDLLDDTDDIVPARSVIEKALEHACGRMFPDLMPSADDDGGADPSPVSATGSVSSE